MKLLILSIALSSIISSALYGEDWIMSYYLNPTPEEFIDQVEVLKEKGVFEKDSAKWPFVSFVSQLMADNPTKVREWMEFGETLGDSGLETMRLAAWYSRTAEAKEYFGKKELSNYAENQAPDILKLEVNNPTTLDMLWAYFFATGEKLPLERICLALELSKYTDAVDNYKDSEKTEEDKKNLYLGATFQSAMWSIEVNCRNYQLVLEHFRSIFHDAKTPKAQSLWIGVILSKVVPNEVSITIEDRKENQTGGDSSE